jgi:cell fate regulator YaaT (PSP1 superfamily)
MEVEGWGRTRCHVPPDLAINAGDMCIFEVQGVSEYGRVVRLEHEGGPAAGGHGGRVLRRATLQDQATAHESAVLGRMALERCTAAAARAGLDIQIVRARYNFDKSVLKALFMSEQRVDFRQMVADLAGELRVRVELRQIGVRDEAAMIGGIGPCGLKLCCCSWLNEFAPINVRMAKAQRMSLNPWTIGGMCGRLKCCLRYEEDTYRELDRWLPR